MGETEALSRLAHWQRPIRARSFTTHAIANRLVAKGLATSEKEGLAARRYSITKEGKFYIQLGEQQSAVTRGRGDFENPFIQQMKDDHFKLVCKKAINCEIVLCKSCKFHRWIDIRNYYFKCQMCKDYNLRGEWRF